MGINGFSASLLHKTKKYMCLILEAEEISEEFFFIYICSNLVILNISLLTNI